ncbi:MAG: hypothetical protein WC378_13455, partial [Opitutaceae bacterium]
ADLRSQTSDFPADSGFRLLASGLFGCGSAALCLIVAIQPLPPSYKLTAKSYKLSSPWTPP